MKKQISSELDVNDVNNFDILVKKKAYENDNIKQKKSIIKTNKTDFIQNKLNQLDKKEKKIEVCEAQCYLNSRWTIWVHRNECMDWTESSYKDIWSIDSLETFWQFFSFFHLLDKENNQFFMMRNKIKPIWEDNYNREGGICSIKMDCYDKNNSYDIGSEVMICFCMLLVNETFIFDNNEINGISYSIKNRSILIKIWSKNFKNDISEKIPKNLINKISLVIKNCCPHKKINNYISIRYTEIKPEYQIDSKV